MLRPVNGGLALTLVRLHDVGEANAEPVHQGPAGTGLTRLPLCRTFPRDPQLSALLMYTVLPLADVLEDLWCLRTLSPIYVYFEVESCKFLSFRACFIDVERCFRERERSYPR